MVPLAATLVSRGYTIRVPAARLYFGVPPGVQLPAGLQLNPLVPDAMNDFRMDLFALTELIGVALPKYVASG